MLYLLAGAALGLAWATLRDEFRDGGALHWRGRFLEVEDVVADLLSFPLPDGWDEHDVALTYAEISSL